MQHPAEGSEKKRILSGLIGRPESLPVLLFLLFFAILYAAGPDLRSAKYVIEPPWLFPTLNTIFITGLCLLIAGLCFRSFLRVGFLNVLLLGCGVLAFALSSFAAGWLIRPPHGVNDTVTIHNIGVLCAAVFFFLSSLFTAFGFSMEIERRRTLVAAASYIAVFLLGAVLTAETVRQALPPFYVIGEGPTALRQVVLSVSVTLLITSALLMMTVYTERKTGFLLYSINALLLIGAGFIGVALGVPGSPLSWLGRAAQYMGNVYLAIAAMQALTEARSRGTTIEGALADFFRKSESHYRALIEMAPDAIVSIDRRGTIFLMNPAAEETFGYARDEAAGQNLAELIVPEQSRELFHTCLYSTPCRNIGMDLMRKDGTVLPAELSFSPEARTGGGVTRNLIIRDITERRQAEEALKSAALSPFQNPSPILRIHRDGTLLFSNPAAEAVLAEWRTASGNQIPEWVRRAVEAALNEGTPRDFEIHIAGREFSFVVTPVVESDYSNLYVWDVTTRKQTEAALQKSEERYRRLFESMNEGFALHELLYDESGMPCDYRFLDVNPAFERLTGLKRQDVLGRTVMEVLPGTEPYWLKRYGEVTLSGTPAHFESHSSALDRDYEVFAYRPAPGQFAVIFLDITERMRIEEALLRAKDYSETLIRTANVLIVGLDDAGNVQTFNDAAEEITGFTRAEMLGRNWFEVAVPRDRYPHVWDEFLRIQKQSFPSEFENPILTKDGRERVISWRNSEIRKDGRARGTISFGRDVTDSRRAEEALRASYDLLKLAQRAANAGIWGWDLSTGTLTWSEEFYSLFCLDPAAGASFDTWLGVLHPDDRQPAIEKINRSIREGTPLENEYRIIRSDGRERWIRALGSTFYNENGQPVSMSGICIDATESKRAEEALRASELRMKAVADHLPVGVWFADETGKIVYGNEAGRRIWAGAHYVDPEEFRVYKAWWADTGKPLGPEDWAVVRAVRKGETSLKEVLDIECFDGTKKTILNSAVPLESADGGLLGVVVLNEDITERIEAERALQKVKDELEDKVRERTAELILLLEDLEKSRDDLRKLASELVLAEEKERKRISVTLHDEVAQTLAAARMRIDLLRSKPGGDDSRRALDEAQQLLVQAIRETRSLMTDISNPVLYDMGLQVAVQSLTEEVKSRNGISVSSSISGSLRNLGQDMEVMIFQLVKELVQNIVKHSGARNASVRIAEERNDITVVVADDGLGFEAGNVGAVGVDGGFGLFSIRERVKSYGGKIRIDSEPGKGSEVTIMLPKKAGSSAASSKTGKRKEKS